MLTIHVDFIDPDSSQADDFSMSVHPSDPLSTITSFYLEALGKLCILEIEGHKIEDPDIVMFKDSNLKDGSKVVCRRDLEKEKEMGVEVEQPNF